MESVVWCSTGAASWVAMYKLWVHKRDVFAPAGNSRSCSFQWKQWPRPGWNERITLSHEKWCCRYCHHHSFNFVFCLCHIFSNILFCHKTSLWWGQTLHLTIRATLALYFFFLQLSKIRAAAVGLQLLLLWTFTIMAFHVLNSCVSLFFF